MTKLEDEKFRKTVLTIMDEDVIMKFSNREGNAADFYDLEESEYKVFYLEKNDTLKWLEE